MVRNNNYFLLSGFISLSLFTFFLSLFFYMLFSTSKIESYSLKKDDFISISIELPKLEPKSAKKSVTTPVVNTPTPVESKEIKIDDLFSEVWTKDIKKIQDKKTKVENKRLQKIQKRIETTKNNEVKSITQKVLEIGDSKQTVENTPSSTSSEVNEYLAKIQALVYNYFHPPQNSQGYSVKALIVLSAIGKVIDFRVLNYSTNAALNEESKKIKERLLGVLFPMNPDNKSGNYIIILKSQE